MRHGFAKAWRRTTGALQLLARAVGGVFDKEDVLILLGLTLLSGGLWLWSHALALVISGAVLLWMFLPPRPPFVETAPPTRARRMPS